MLTNTERQQIVEEVNAGTYGIDEALDDIAAAQKGEEVRKALYAEALVLNREGHAGSTDMIARQQIANLQTSVNGQISTLRTEVGDDIDDLEAAFNSGLATQDGKIAAQNATIANVVANYNVEYGSTELWASTGETGALAAGTTVTLSEDVSHFDYIDIYSFCGNSNVLDTVPVDAKLQSNAGYALRWVNLSDPGSGTYEAYVRIVETKIKIIGTTLTIVHQVTYRNGSSVTISGEEITQSNRSTYMGELGIMKIVGRKITANTEIEDVRIGANGTEYASAGQAVRGQITEVKAQIPLIDASLATAGKAADAKATGDALTTVNGRLEDAEEMLGITTTAISFTSGAYIKTGNVGKVGTIIDLTPVANTSYRYAIISCNPGDVFTVDLAGGNTPRAWAFLDSNNAILSNSKSGHIAEDVVVPVNASKIVLNDNSNGFAYKTSGTDKIGEIENAVDNLEEVVNAITSPIIRYVSTDGDDANDGMTLAKAYKTIGKALSEGADVIFISRGTYNEDSIPENKVYRGKSIRIVGNGSTLNTKEHLHFRLCHVDISGLNIVVANAISENVNGFFLLKCSGTLTDCSVSGAPHMGFRLDDSKVTLTRCIANQCGIDGFNAHTIDFEPEITLVDCISCNNGDDGASIHENGKMYVYGGEYYNNVQTGLAPHDKCEFEVCSVHCHHNGKGIEALKDTLAEGDTPAVGRIIGCILNDNTTYGLDVKNYTVNALANGYANNGTAPTRAQTGGTINNFSVI